MTAAESSSHPNFETLFNASPNAYVLLDKHFMIVEANETYLELTGRDREALRGQHVFEAFPGDSEDTNARRLRASFERVLSTGERDSLAFIPYSIPRETDEGTEQEERYWSATHTPIFDEEGEVAFILQHTTDVTDLYRAKSEGSPDDLPEEGDPPPSPIQAGDSERAAPTPEHRITPQQVEEGVLNRAEAVQKAYWRSEEEREHLQRLFEQAPGFMVFQRGPEHVYEMANEAYYELIGRRDIIGKPVREVLPEIEGQGFFELLDRVYETGEPFVGREVEVQLHRESDQELETVYVDFIYQPIIEPDGSVSGIFTQGHDVTEKKRTKDRLRQRKTELKELNETLEERVEERTRQVRALTSRVTMAEQRERERIARLLHDDLQQRFYGVQLKMSSLRQRAQSIAEEKAPQGPFGELVQEAKKMEDQMEGAIQALRQLSVGMSPPVLRSEGLKAALEWLTSHMKEARDLNVRLLADSEFRVEEEMRVLLFQVTRELLISMDERVEVNEATVELYEDGGDLVIRVSDEGIGFAPEKSDAQTPEEAFGLTADRERLRLFGGDLNVRAAPGGGMKVTLHVPLDRSPTTPFEVPAGDGASIESEQ